MFRSNKPLIAFDQKQGSSPLLTTAGISAAGIGFVSAHRYLMRNYPKFAESSYNFFTKLEDRSPNNILRTFGLSELYSSYITPNLLTIGQEDILTGGNLNEMGQHLQRMLGNKLDLTSRISQGPLRFLKNPSGSPFMRLEGQENIGVRFFRARTLKGQPAPGRIVSSSQRLGAPLEAAPFDWLHPSSVVDHFLPKQPFTGFRDSLRWTRDLLHNVGSAQFPKAIYKSVLADNFQPGAVHFDGSPLRNLASSTERVGFLMGERVQTLLADVRLGLWNKSYNRLLHVPFMGGPNKGLINELLTKRALPIYLGAVGLGYADYLTHHVVSNTLIDLYQQTRVAHAKLTDIVPGARSVTNAYEDVLPGNQYGPLALPLAGTTAGALYHYSKVLSGLFINEKARSDSARVIAKVGDESFLKYFNKKSPIAIGMVVGFAALIPFIPGILGSRKTARELQDIYSGEEPVPIRSGRWWDLGTTPWEGNRIKEYRPHWTVLHKSHAEQISLYGSEEEYWSHNPIIHPLRWLRDPYWLERKHYQDRPYPVTSPAFSDVPLIGPLLASTIGKVIKPPVTMHPDWNNTDYDIGSSRLQPKGPDALPPAVPKAEFGILDSAKREVLQFSELIGLPGFIARTLYGNAYPTKDAGQNVYLQGSRMMESISRRYYEKELGAGYAPDPELGRPLGYSEALRRFIQPEPKRIEVNQIPNTMPSWLPDKDYFLNFRVGDPYSKIPDGYARLPGEGYESLHPEVAGVNPEDYPDLTKMAILGDVAPYSVEYRRAQSAVRRQSIDNTQMQIEYEKIVDRVKAMKDSVVRTDDRRFSKEITKATGKISRVTGLGVELEEYPGREFRLSSVGYSAADQSAIVLGEHNDWSKTQVAVEVANRQASLIDFFNDYLQPGTNVGITVPAGSLDSQERISTVFEASGVNINKALLDQGLGQYRKDLGGPESQAMFGWLGQLTGEIAENLSFTGDEARWNPLRYIPTPGHTKLWQERTPLAQYQQQEVEGARLRRWQHPLEDFLMPYARGVYRRVVGNPHIPTITQKKWDLNTMADMLEYVRGIQLASSQSDQRGRYTSQASRTSIGVDQFAQPSFLASTLNGRDATYFQRFLRESDPNERIKILSSVPPEMAKSLATQWIQQQANIAIAEGRKVSELGEGGRLYNDADLEDYSKADTKLNYGDYQRSKEVAEFFTSRGLNLPEDATSPLYNPSIDYEDVKMKIVQQEGYDAHDFGFFDDRAALLWRKPYIDGAIRELTGSGGKSTEVVRQAVEGMILAAHDKNPKVSILSSQSRKDKNNVTIDVDLDEQAQLLQEIRRNPDRFQ
jgi:hypothetical protein